MTTPASEATEATRELEEERDFLLRSLRDLDTERAAGDIDEADYQELRAEYTARAAAALRALEPAGAGAGVGAAAGAVGVGPAEVGAAVAAGVGPGEAGAAAVESGGVAPGAVGPAAGRGRNQRRPRRWARRGRVSLSRRSFIALAVVVVPAGVGWAVVASSSQRQAGEEITGQGVGASQVTSLLLEAQKAADRGDTVTELRDAQSILNSDPSQPQALTMEGWLLAQTQQRALVTKGIGLLTLAEEVDPSFAEPHVYRGIAFLSEGDDRDAVPELKWYLAHHPDPKLVPKVRAALAEAEAQAAAAK